MAISTRWLAIGAAALLAGCGTVSYEPTEADLRAAWESHNVPVADYKADILAFMRSYLNDPTQIRNAAVSELLRKQVPGDPAERYIACVRYTAKKSNGSYAASKLGVAVYASGKLEHFVDTPRIAEAVCKDLPLSPFPQLQSIAR